MQTSRNSAIRVASALIVVAAGWLAVIAPTALADPPAAPAPPRLTCTKTWSGPAGGAWTSDNNWTPAGAPTTTDAVCISGGSPVIAKTDQAQAGALVAIHGASLRVDGSLSMTYAIDPTNGEPVVASLINSDISGSGRMVETVPGGVGETYLSGVRLSGVLVAPGATIEITGNRPMCGGPSALCLAKAARLIGVGIISYHGPGSIRDDGSATEIDSPELDVASADATALVIDPQLTFGAIAATARTATPATLTLHDLAGLAADGTLNAGLAAYGPMTVVIPNSIVTTNKPVHLAAASRLITPLGDPALAGLTTNNGEVSAPSLATVTPEGGTLVNTGGLLLGNTTVAGDIVNHGYLNLDKTTVDGSLTSDYYVAVSSAVVSGSLSLSAGTSGGHLRLSGDLLTPSIQLTGGSMDLVGGAAIELGSQHTGQLTVTGGQIRLYDKAASSIDGDIRQSGGTISATGTYLYSGVTCNTANVTGSYTASGQTTWRMVILARGSCGPLLTVDGPVALPGTLNLGTKSAGSLPTGTERAVVTSQTGVTGTFQQVTDSQGETWTPSYTATQAIVTKTSAGTAATS